jgi:hypothetical protein
MFKIKILTFLAFLSLKGTFSYSQNNKEASLYFLIDKELSTGNALVNNGKFHVNVDNTFKNEHRYFLENKVYTEEIKFDNEVYFNNKIKYDLFKDELVLNPENQSDKLFIILDKTRVNHFTIQNRKFVKLQLTKDGPLQYVEESINTKNFIFYIKFKKVDKEIIGENGVFVSYLDDNKYFVLHNRTLYEITSKKSVLKLFPEFKSEINDYYKFYRTLEKENNVKFMENLMLTIKKSFHN